MYTRLPTSCRESGIGEKTTAALKRTGTAIKDTGSALKVGDTQRQPSCPSFPSCHMCSSPTLSVGLCTLSAPFLPPSLLSRLPSHARTASRLPLIMEMAHQLHKGNPLRKLSSLTNHQRSEVTALEHTVPCAMIV